MKVVNIIGGLHASLGGPVTSLLESSMYLPSSVERAIITTDNVGPARARRRGRLLPSHLPPRLSEYVSVEILPVQGPPQLLYSHRLRSVVRSYVERGYIPHVHSLYLYPQFATYWVCRNQRWPYIVSPHGSLQPVLLGKRRWRKALAHRIWQYRMLEEARAVLATSDAEREAILQLLPAARVRLVPSGIDARPYDELATARYRKARRGSTVTHLGRLAHTKGLDQLIRAFAIVAARAPESRLVLAGPDDEGLRPELVRLAEKLNIGGQVEFPGFVTGAEKLCLLASTDVWVMASSSESFGVAALEAAAAGLPMVLSPNVPLGKELADAGAAVQIECLDAHNLSRAIETLINDPQLAARLGARARAIVKERYSWSSVSENLVALYEEVKSDTARRDVD